MRAARCDQCDTLPHVRAHTGWNLGDSCKGKFEVGERVVTRGDFGRFRLWVRVIHNEYYVKCSVWRWGRLRHFNMNVLEKLPRKRGRAWA